MGFLFVASREEKRVLWNARRSIEDLEELVTTTAFTIETDSPSHRRLFDLGPREKHQTGVNLQHKKSNGAEAGIAGAWVQFWEKSTFLVGSCAYLQACLSRFKRISNVVFQARIARKRKPERLESFESQTSSNLPHFFLLMATGEDWPR